MCNTTVKIMSSVVSLCPIVMSLCPMFTGAGVAFHLVRAYAGNKRHSIHSSVKVDLVIK